MKTYALIVLCAFAGAAQAGPLEDRIAHTPDGHWLSYAVPMLEGHGTPCCFDPRGGHAMQQKACDLEAKRGSWGVSDDAHLPQSVDLDVYLRVEHGKVTNVRSFGDACAVRTDNIQLETLDNVSEPQSLAFLATLAKLPERRAGGDPLVAVALHRTDAATQTLAGLAAPGNDDEVRRDATFWLGQSRGKPGFDVVRALFARDTDENYRQHAVFSLSQAHVPERDTVLRDIARGDRSERTRGEALFWLAQINSPLARAEIDRTIRESSTRAARERAITALAQMPADQATPALKALVADKTLPRETRKQALFWLAQSDDDNARKAADELFGALVE